MAKHTVTFAAPERELGKADLEFKVRRDGDLLGRLKVSNGSVVWVEKDKTYGFKIGWVELVGLIKTNGTKENE
ncbi:MAG: hypothetical protein HYV96_18880 [Opitutae bacterium]|nr:hypothetical protein [Opitutae bacterium]